MQEIAIDTQRMLSKMKTTKLFRHLTDEEREHFLRHCACISCGENETVIREHEKSDALYVIAEGSAHVDVREGNKDVYICTLGEGDVFGEAGLFANLERTASVRTNDGALLLKIDRKRFMAAVTERPSAGIKILFIVIYALLKKLREANLELAFERKDDYNQAEVDALIESLTGAKKNLPPGDS